MPLRNLDAGGSSDRRSRRVARALGLVGVVAMALAALDHVHGVTSRPWRPMSAGDVVGAMALTALCTFGIAAGSSLVPAAGIWLHHVLGLKGRHRSATRFAAVATAVSSPILYVAALQPFIGNRYSGTAIGYYGPWLLWPVLVLLAFGATVLLVWFLGWTRTRAGLSGRHALAVATCSMVVAGVLFRVDSTWYVGWYPLVHTTLSMATALLLGFALWTLSLRWHQARTTLRVAGTGWLLLVCCAPVLLAVVWSPRVPWRVATGTVFSARLIEPLLHLRQRQDPYRPLASLARGANPAPSNRLQAPAARTQARNAVVFSVDALRWDHVGLYMGGPSLTPAIDAYFAGGTVVDRAYAQYASTAHSVRALLHSQFQHTDGSRGDDLISVLRENGVASIAILPSDFKVFVQVEEYNFAFLHYYESHDEILPTLQRALEQVADERRLVWIHAYQPHDPYTPASHEGHRDIDLYRGEVREMDALFSSLLPPLARLPEAITVLTADHGEEFGEHGGTLHGRTLYDETIRVPLLIRGPGVAVGRTRGLAGSLDLPPTLLGAMGIMPPDSYRGIDLGAAGLTLPPRDLFAESPSNLVGVIRGDSKWIFSSANGLMEQYDLGRDPGELLNLAVPGATSWSDGADALFGAWLRHEGGNAIRAAGPSRYRRVLSDLRTGRISLPDRVRAALFAIARRFEPDDALMADLRALLAVEEDHEARASLLSALGRRDANEPWFAAAVVRVVSALPSAVSTDGLIVTDTVRRALIPLLESPDTRLRRRLVAVLGADPASVPRLTELATRDPDAEVRLRSRAALLRAGVGSVEDALASLDDPEPRLRAAAVQRLGEARTSRAVAMLQERWSREKVPSVRDALLTALAVAAPEASRAAFAAEYRERLLSDRTRAELIVRTRSHHQLGHLLELFDTTTSRPFQRRLVTLIGQLLEGAPERASVLGGLEERTFDWRVRREIRAQLAARQ